MKIALVRTAAMKKARRRRKRWRWSRLGKEENQGLRWNWCVGPTCMGILRKDGVFCVLVFLSCSCKSFEIIIIIMKNFNRRNFCACRRLSDPG